MQPEFPAQIGPYVIDREIGRGGMGVVYLGHDTKLDRPVAVKAMSGELADDPERLARFEREARVVASLSHGNIATVYGFEEVDGARYLIMEFVEGETLGERLADGALSMTEALSVCSQIAAGVEAAHDAGIIHRDLKPGNVIIRPDGTAKVLDFGVAREMSTQTSRTDLASAPTVKKATAVTAEGVSIGTPGYMSPEQVRGRSVDRRTDTFAFGCIVYECLSGHQAFPGETATDSFAAILEREPDWSLLPDGTPPTIQLLLRRCLQKDRRRRLRDMGDARIEIEQAIDDPASTSLGLAGFALRSTREPHVPKGYFAIGVLAVLVAAAAAWLLKPAPPAPRPPVARMSFDLDVRESRLQATFSPDGTKFVFAADAVGEASEEDEESRLWLRRLDTFEPMPIPGTEGAHWPVFSPDSQRILFVVTDESRSGREHEAELRIVGLDGRPPLTIAPDALDHAPPTWLTEDEVAYIHGTEMQQIFRLSARGGDPELVAEIDDAVGSLRRINALPGGEWIALDTRQGPKQRIHVIGVDGGDVHPLLEDAAFPGFVGEDIMLFGRDDALLATKIVEDGTAPPRCGGELIAVLSDGVDMSTFGFVEAYASASGHLAYAPKGTGSDLSNLVTIDFAGNEEPFPAEPRRYFGIVGLSPDGTRLAYAVEGDDRTPEIWVMDLDTGGTRRRSAPDTPAFGGGWLPDGRLVFINFEDFGTTTIMVTEMRRNAEPQPLFADGLGDESLELRGEPVIAPDGTMIYLTVVKEDRETDIYARPLDGSTPAQPVVATAAMERRPRVSPDGRWLAFVSDESGRFEVYVRPVDDAADGDDDIKRISRTGGSQHFWSVDGKQLFYQHEEALYVVDNDTTGGDFEASAPRVLLDSNDVDFSWRASLTPMPDGERLLFVKQSEGDEENGPEGRRVNVILNWVEELEWE